MSLQSLFQKTLFGLGIIYETAGKSPDSCGHVDTINQIKGVRCGMEGKRLTYQALIKHNGLKSGAKTVAVT